ncbi:MAG TPA: aldehyde dehydrogenase family protein [Bacteroidales bacterium]|nr:aldehyde dehydrogenase family protein [Bacteroidales bacterium]HRZ48610.1 aldehyde dehydrogenase family protein [Bacteroidales bacterium]
MTTFPIYVAGRFIEGHDLLEVINPYTGRAFASTWRAGTEHLEESIAAAIAVTEEMKNMPSYQRSAILQEIAAGIEDNAAEFSEVLAMEAGKPVRYATGEVLRAMQVFRVAAEECKRLPGEYLSLDWTPAGTGKEGWVKHFPVGPVAAIAPFNFPLNLAVHKIAPAIATGCPVVLKPATSTPLSTLLLARLIDQTDLPKGAVSILPLDRTTGNLMVTDERFKLLTFTGSPEVGWEMKRKAGKKKVVLELGGNAGLIITPTADLQAAVPKAVAGSFAYSGQVCIHTQRIMVHRSVFGAFADAFTRQTLMLQQGDPLDPETEISVMIDQGNAIRVEEWVAEAVAGGAEVLCGGVRRGTFFEPTVLTGTRNHMKVCALEVFGPVVTLEPYDTFEEAVAIVNHSRYGLQAGVFTQNIREMDYAFNHLEVGGVIINDVPTFRVDHMPYGGVKESGLGREGVKYAMLDMLEPRLLVK